MCSVQTFRDPGATSSDTVFRSTGSISNRHRKVGGIRGKSGANPPQAPRKSFESEGGQPLKNVTMFPVISSSYACEKWMEKQAGTSTEKGSNLLAIVGRGKIHAFTGALPSIDRHAAGPFRFARNGRGSIDKALTFITMRSSVMAMSWGASSHPGITKVFDATGVSKPPSSDHSVKVTSRLLVVGSCLQCHPTRLPVVGHRCGCAVWA
mmetsp:Transcript_1649/g.4260  ORF Transcript_1649/g.4260 Transcript_1649/m.4260 type:complete len:208 (+) Transcript_1649:430-1053(+)